MTAPVDPIEGQLWYDTVSGVLFVSYNSNWVEATAIPEKIFSGSTPPSSPALDDIWYDTVSGKLFIYYNNNWIDISATGDIGYTGSAGYQGRDGYVGSKGDKGDPGNPGGFTGSTGISGVDGFTGSTGISGVDGYTGSAGERGRDGRVGNDGYTGSAGSRGTAGVDGRNVTASTTAPVDPIEGQLWYDTVSGRTYVYYSGTWVDADPIELTTVAASPPTSPHEGSQWYDTVGGRLYIYYSGNWVDANPVDTTGFVGSVAGNGYTGSAGINGAVGSQGVTGSQGPIGYTGSGGSGSGNGYTGSAGVDGYVGSAGSNGVDGYVGSTGLGFTFYGEWTGTTHGYYIVNDVATYNGSSYICVNPVYGNDPPNVDISWQLFISKGDPGYVGSAGTNGIDGYTGSQSYTGSQGYIGSVGYSGSQGPYGYTGSIPGTYVSGITAGTGTSVSTSTGAVTVWFNTGTLVAQAVSVVGGIGVASLTAGTGTSVSTSTGAVTVWFNTGTLVTTAVNATTATNAATAYSTVGTHSTGTGILGTSFNGSSNVTWSLNTATLMANAVTANTSTYAQTVTASAQPNITSVGTLTSLIVTGNINAGVNTFTKSPGAGDIAMDNNSTDTPGLLMYYANNSNWGIDSWNGTFDILSGQLFRVTNKLNETGGAVKMAIDTSGNAVFTGFVQANAWRAGQVIKETVLGHTDVTQTQQGGVNRFATDSYNREFIRYAYTPSSSSSYIVVTMTLAKYSAYQGTGNDSYFSQMQVGATSGYSRNANGEPQGLSEVAYSLLSTVNGNRTGTLFPLMGRYTNGDTNSKTISIAVRKESADDYWDYDWSASSFCMRITEIAR